MPQASVTRDLASSPTTLRPGVSNVIEFLIASAAYPAGCGAKAIGACAIASAPAHGDASNLF